MIHDGEIYFDTVRAYQKLEDALKRADERFNELFLLELEKEFGKINTVEALNNIQKHKKGKKHRVIYHPGRK